MDFNPKLKELSHELGNITDTFTSDEHLSIYDWSEKEKLGELSLKQYRYLILLWRKNEYFKIKEILDKYINHK